MSRLFLLFNCVVIVSVCNAAATLLHIYLSIYLSVYLSIYLSLCGLLGLGRPRYEWLLSCGENSVLHCRWVISIVIDHLFEQRMTHMKAGWVNRSLMSDTNDSELTCP